MFIVFVRKLSRSALNSGIALMLILPVLNTTIILKQSNKASRNSNSRPLRGVHRKLLGSHDAAFLNTAYVDRTWEFELFINTPVCKMTFKVNWSVLRDQTKS